MKISTILDHIDNGHMALPEFQRGYVWNRDQVRGLFDSLYKRHPVGGLLVWATASDQAAHRGTGQLAAGIVKLLLDGQQRITSLYGVVRGKSPEFFDGNARAFTQLYFNLDTETFGFFQPLKMKDDPLWIDVTQLMQKGSLAIGEFALRFNTQPDMAEQASKYLGRLSQLLGITEIDLHIEEVTGVDKSLDVVVDIFNRVNSGGTKLSKGDLALAKICADWPEGRAQMKAKLKQWEKYGFDLDWLLRSLNTVLTGEAKFQHLHEKNTDEIKNALERTSKHIDYCLNLISDRLGLDHDRVFFGRYAIPVMARYLEQQPARTKLGRKEQDKLLFWYAQAAMWGRFSGSTESFIDQDLAVLEEGNLDQLLEQLRLWHGGLMVEPGHFTGNGLGARFYPVLYMLTRMNEAKDWGTGLSLKADLNGKMSKLEVHHIFPKAQLYKRGEKKTFANALANFCFLTKSTNINISDRLPEAYFPEIEAAHPGALASQWIPQDPALWKIERFHDFLEARKILLAAEINQIMEKLLHGDNHWLITPTTQPSLVAKPSVEISIEEEETQLAALNEWLASEKLPCGVIGYDFSDPHTGEQIAVFDIAWPNGLQESFTQPIAILLNESSETIAIASQAGFQCFTNTQDFKNHVQREIFLKD
jgi:hypothetical protein